MSDIVAQLEVLSRDSGCILDISAIVDLSVCSKIDVKTHKPHKVEEKDDYICVTPTEPKKNKDKKRCDKKTCYEPRPEVCTKPTVAYDQQLAALLDLLSKADLEKYLQTMGDLDEDEELDMGDGGKVKMDPLLSLGVGEDDSILNLEVDNEDGLVDLDLQGDNLLTLLPKEGGLLKLGDDKKGGLLGGKDGEGLLGGLLKGLGLRRRNCGGECNSGSGSGSGNGSGNGKGGNKKLLDVDVGGQKDAEEATIDVDVLTHPRRWARRQDKGLLDIDIGGTADEDEATIDLDLLTTRPKPSTGNTTPAPGTGNTTPKPKPGSGNTTPKPKPGGSNNNGGKNPLTHYQPICNKGFKPGHRDGADKCHAQDVNHCLAICHSASAMATLHSGAKAGETAKILLCAAIEFDASADEGNCHYFIAPETQPCRDDELEEKEGCVSFIRN